MRLYVTVSDSWMYMAGILERLAEPEPAPQLPVRSGGGGRGQGGGAGGERVTHGETMSKAQGRRQQAQ